MKIEIEVSDETFRQYNHYIQDIQSPYRDGRDILAARARQAILNELRTLVSCKTEVIKVKILSYEPTFHGVGKHTRD